MATTKSYNESIGTRSKKRRLSESIDGLLSRSVIDESVSTNLSKMTLETPQESLSDHDDSGSQVSDEQPVRRAYDGSDFPHRERENFNRYSKIQINNNKKKTAKNKFFEDYSSLKKLSKSKNTESQNFPLWSYRDKSDNSEEFNGNYKTQPGYNSSSEGDKQQNQKNEKNIHTRSRSNRDRDYKDFISDKSESDTESSEEEPSPNESRPKNNLAREKNDIINRKENHNLKRTHKQDSENSVDELTTRSSKSADSRSTKNENSRDLIAEKISPETESSSPKKRNRTNISKENSKPSRYYKKNSINSDTYDSYESSTTGVSTRLTKKDQNHGSNKNSIDSNSENEPSPTKKLQKGKRESKNSESPGSPHLEKRKENKQKELKKETDDPPKRSSRMLKEKVESKECEISCTPTNSKKSRRTSMRYNFSLSELDSHRGSSWDVGSTPPRRFSLRLLEKNYTINNTPQSNGSSSQNTPSLRGILKNDLDDSILFTFQSSEKNKKATKKTLKKFEADESISSNDMYDDSSPVISKPLKVSKKRQSNKKVNSGRLKIGN